MITPAGSDDGDILHFNACTSALLWSHKGLKGIREHVNINRETVFMESAKNKAVRKLIDDWIMNISFGIYNLAATLNPQKILIGGGVSAQPGLLSDINNQLPVFNLHTAKIDLKYIHKIFDYP